MGVSAELIPDNLRLISVVTLSAVLLCSQDVLENQVTGNKYIASVGAACYSIFIWHQIVIAFCRYFITSHFTITVFLVLLIITALLSWLSYRYIEQTIAKTLKKKQDKNSLYILVGLVFVALNIYAAYIYMIAGVVRDIPELYISVNDKHRGLHAEYVDRGYKYDKPFTTKKPHWYIIGDSFGRDFVNIILESPVANAVEISYSKSYCQDRIANADLIFLSTRRIKENMVIELEVQCLANGLSREQLVIVGEKNFGVSNGGVYIKRGSEGYFEQFVEVEGGEMFIERNKQFAKLYGERYLDLMNMVLNENNQVRVFSPDHHFISADCIHLSRGGAIYFANLIDWKKYFK